MTADDSINEDLPTISEDLVVTKYKMAAEIANSECSMTITTQLRSPPCPHVRLVLILCNIISHLIPGAQIYL